MLKKDSHINGKRLALPKHIPHPAQGYTRALLVKIIRIPIPRRRISRLLLLLLRRR